MLIISSISKTLTLRYVSFEMPALFGEQVTIQGSLAHEERQLARESAREVKKRKLTQNGSRRTSTVATEGCTADQIGELTKWNIDAWDKIQAARACTDSSCATLVPACPYLHLV